MGCIGLSCKLSIESNETCVVKFEFSPLETLIVHHEYSNVSSTAMFQVQKKKNPWFLVTKMWLSKNKTLKAPQDPPNKPKPKSQKTPPQTKKKKTHTQNSQKPSQLRNTSKYMTLLLHKNNKVH